MIRRVALVLAVLFIVVAVGRLAAEASPIAAISTPITDSLGCDGLTVYQSQMLAAKRSLLAAMAAGDMSPARDPLTYSSDEWRAYAHDVAAYQKALKAITPPPFARAWHEARIEWAGTMEQAAIIASTNGALAAASFGPVIDRLNAQTAKAFTAASAACIDFPEFGRAWDALTTAEAATPAATPVT